MTRRLFAGALSAIPVVKGEPVSVDTRDLTKLSPGGSGQKKRLLAIINPLAFELETLSQIPFPDDLEVIAVYSYVPTTDIKIFNLDAIPQATVDGLLEEIRAISDRTSPHESL